MLNGICQDHKSDRFALLYPKFGHIGSDGSRSRSRHGTSGRFQLINLGRSPTANAHDLSVLDESSLGRLLLGRLEECKDYLERMSIRVQDRSSRVLVTGDVNGGKSTFINALLGHDPPILPMDQQPCTQAFCEVVPIAASRGPEDNDSLTVKAIPDYLKYSKTTTNPDTFDSMSLSRMQAVIQEEDTPYQWYIVKCPVQRSSMLCNDLVQVSLIDSPGLNSDLFKTMNLFARQEEIDVIVFVINAANHVTLSARQFLETASRDKQYIFIVVNKFDDIKNQEKCRRIILQQIGEVLPATFSESQDLVHFVSAKSYLEQQHHHTQDVIKTHIDVSDPFEQLEACLADFILSKRTMSKLLPAKTYLCNLLCDLNILFEHNERHCQQSLMAVRRDIDVLSPCYEELVKREAPLKHDILHGVTDCSLQIYNTCQQRFTDSLPKRIEDLVNQVPWMGWWQVWRWRRVVLEGVTEEAKQVVREAEADSKELCQRCVEYLQVCCQEHAPSVYPSTSPPVNIPPNNTTPIDTLDTVPTWSLFEWSVLLGGVGVKAGGGGVLAAGSLAMAMPYMAWTNNLPSVLTAVIYRKPRLLFAVIAVSAGSALLYLINDLQRSCRLHLRHLLLTHYTSPSWRHCHSHAIESRCHQHLLACSNSLLSRFQEALQQQRRLRAEKDLERAQLQGRLEQVVMVTRKISLLYDHVKSLNLD